MRLFFIFLLLSILSVPSFALYDPNAESTECPEGELCITSTYTSLPAPVMQSSYETSEELLQVEGQICRSATDGVNIFVISDAQLGASTRMGYPENFVAEWKCNAYLTQDMMLWSENDRNRFNSLLKNTPQEQKSLVALTVTKIQNYINSQPMVLQEKYMDAVLELIDSKKMEIILSYPQDIALPEEFSNVYNMLTLLRFTLMTL